MTFKTIKELSAIKEIELNGVQIGYTQALKDVVELIKELDSIDGFIHKEELIERIEG